METIKQQPSLNPENTLIDPVLFDCSGAQGTYRKIRKETPCNRESLAFSNCRSLPVRGRAQGGSDGNVVVEEHPIDWTFRPADLQGVNDAFAVYVSGASMSPKYKNGDLVYVHPTKRVAKGRYVLVETREHKGFIKQFVAWRNDTLVLQQFNPAKEIVLPKSEILRVMLAIGSIDC